MDHWGIGNDQWALAFSMMLILWPIGMLASAKIVDRGNANLSVAGGGVLIGSGLLFAGSAGSPLSLYVSFAMMSLGIGFSYGAVVALAVKWFPERRGMASGLTVGALGFGTAIIAAVAQWLLESRGVSVAFLLKLFGMVFSAILLLGALVVANPPKTETGNVSGVKQTPGLHWSQMIRSAYFWLIYALYVCGTFSGLMVISQTASIARNMAELGAAASAGVVSIMGIANAAGRVLWGTLSDSIGRMTAVIGMFLITAGMMFLLPVLARDGQTLAVALAVVGLCFGGFLGTFPSICADSFGSKNAAVNYAFLFTAFGLSGVLGPRVGAMFGDNAAGYAQAFRVAGSVATLGLMMAFLGKAVEARAGQRKFETTYSLAQGDE